MNQSVNKSINHKYEYNFKEDYLDMQKYYMIVCVNMCMQLSFYVPLDIDSNYAAATGPGGRP